MAALYSADQYDSAFSATKLQNWTVPKLYKESLCTHDGFTQFISDDRGHLLPGVPRSKTSPWGTFLGTWDMPCKIPPAKVTLTSRSADASRHLTDLIKMSGPLMSACNGLRPHVTGQVSFKNGAEDPPQQSRGHSKKSERAPPSPQRSACQPGFCNGDCQREQNEAGLGELLTKDS